MQVVQDKMRPYHDSFDSAVNSNSPRSCVNDGKP